MNIKDFKVGQTVYVELTGSASRGKTLEHCIEEWEITYVGKKYIEATKKEADPFLFKTVFEWREEYKNFVQKTVHSINYVLYPTKQEIEEKHEKNRLFREIEQRFSYGSQRDISLEQLRTIHGILDESRMSDIDFLKTVCEICENRCHSDFEDTEQYPHCPFPWRFCDLDRNFYDMTDDELESICEKTKDFKDNFKRK